ncbi:MAG: SCP2 domain-containing protein [Gammaproteobacteria bacterium]|nr:SCP2 domain-containing protein [Gammaproteobacteria bacterium]
MKTAIPKPPKPAAILSKVAKRLTADLPKVIKRLPEPPFVLQKKIGEKVLQHLMAEQIEMGDFDFLDGKWLQINVNDMGLAFFLSFENEKLILSNQITQADVSFSGNSKEFILLASRTEDPDTLFFQRRLMIEGDTELGLYIKNSIDGIDFDNWPNWLNQTIKSIASLVVENDLIDSNKVSEDKLPQDNPVH